MLLTVQTYGDGFTKGGAVLAALRVNTVGKEEGGGRTTLRRTILLLLVVAIMTIVIAGVALARTDYVGGGKWNHGYNSESVWSNYSHKYKCHTASIRSGDKLVSRSQRPPGQTARSSWSNTWKVEQAFWNNEC